MDELMKSAQGGKARLWAGYGPYSGTGALKWTPGSGPTDGTIITSVDLPYTGMTDVEFYRLSAVKDEVYGLLESGGTVQEVTPRGLCVVDYAWPEVELLCPAGSAIEPSDAIMGRDVDRNMKIENQIWTKLWEMEAKVKGLRRSLVIWSKHESNLMKDMRLSGLRAAVVLHPEYDSNEVYLLLKGVDRDAACMLLDCHKWLQRVAVWHHLGPYAWKVKHVMC